MEEAMNPIQEREGGPDQAQNGYSHCHDEGTMGARQSIQRMPPTKEAKRNQQG
jgi:hypothetical protein